MQQATQSSLTTSAILRQETASRGHSACGKCTFDAYTKPAGACSRHLLAAYRSSAPVQCSTTSAEMDTEEDDELPPPADSNNDSSGARVRSRLIERRLGGQQ